MKLHNKIVLALSSLLITTPTLLTVVSCQKDDGEINLFISSRLNYVEVGKNLQLSLFSTPIIIPSNQVEWEIVDNPRPDYIKIDNSGLVNIEESLKISTPISVEVKATWIEKPEVWDTKTIFVCQEAHSQFLGFADNKITYLDRARKEQSIDIVLEPGSTTKYKSARPIDLFLDDDDGYFNFFPVFADRASKNMRFNIVEEDPDKPKQHALKWRLYNDGTLTDTIPQIYVQNFLYRKDTVMVTFECAPEISLQIDFNAWQSFSKTTNGVIDYAPNANDTPGHSVVMAMDGIFDAQMFCPADGSGKYYRDTMTDICFFRKPYEYLQYDRFEIQKNPSIADAIDVKTHIEKTTLREFDEYPTYKVDVLCDFDLSIMKAEEFDSESILLFSIIVYDDFFAPGTACKCDFTVQWTE